MWWDFAIQDWIIQSFLLSSFLSTLICFIMVTYLKFSKDACKPEVKLYGKTVLITGANSGKMKMCPVLNSKVNPITPGLFSN